MSQPRSARDHIDRAIAIAYRTRRFFVPALVCMAVGTLVSVGYALIRKRVFRSETLILYREGIRSADITGGEEQADRTRKLALRLKEMVLSRTRLEQIIKNSNLYPDIVDERGMIEAEDEMRKHIIFRVQDSDTFGLGFEGDEPKRVQEVTAQLANALLAENSRTRSEQAEVTKEFLDREKERTEKDLKEKERGQAEFLGKHPEFARDMPLMGQNGTPGSAVRAAQLKAANGTSARSDPMLASLEREANRLQERLGMPVVRHHTDPQGDPVLLTMKQDAENDLRQAQKELSEKQSEFTEEHPDVRAARAKYRSAQEKLRRATDALFANITAQKSSSARDSAREDGQAALDRGALESQLKKINAEINEYNARRRNQQENSGAGSGGGSSIASSLVALETEWTRIIREVAEARERYQSLQDKQFKASMVETAAASGQTAQMVIIDPAYVPTHAAKPGRTVIVLAGMGVSAVLALLLALGLALIDDRLYDRVDVEQLQILPLLTSVPRADADLQVRRLASAAPTRVKKGAPDPKAAAGRRVAGG